MIIVIVVVLLGIGVAAYLVGKRRRSERLREHFGPEYERTLARTDDERAAERHLAEREKRHRSLDLRPLDDRERADFRDRWLTLQGEFVDDPDRAVERADTFVAEVMHARGYPVADFDQRAEDVSVEHPVVVQRYREARAIAQRNSRGGVDTEELRHAVTSYRALVDALLDESGDHARGESHRGSRDGAPDRHAGSGRHESHGRHESNGRHDADGHHEPAGRHEAAGRHDGGVAPDAAWGRSNRHEEPTR
ncbi:hypothetical protein ACFFOU_16330 [Pseudonocardia sulfidoxydans]|uniref:hypothetical protein n=1 Tax=Pseudonocardia sulfidoxydans TaxID=54011 RepID=UPI001649961F|nr:hypothetical protein [Pseudonocardia sulfidoxydans]